MIALLSILLTFNAFSFPKELSSLYKLLEVHEFYKDNELITKPLDAWQSIASFSSVGSNLSLSKICLKYRPGREAKGLFRVEKLDIDKSCTEVGQMVFEVNSLYGIQFQRKPEFKIFFSHNDYSITEWNFKTQKNNSILTLLDTPQEDLFEGVLFLSENEGEVPLLKDKVQCLEVLEDCSIKGISLCSQCENGSIEAPNGCEIGPRYCSSSECGEKGSPACRRGVKFLKQRVLDCRKDSSFALCAGDATPVCQGQEVWCH